MTAVEQDLPIIDPAALTPPLDTRLVTDASGVEDMMAYLWPLEVVGYDIETNMADDFFTRKVRTVQLGDRNRQYVIDLLPFAGSEEAMMQQGGCVAPVWAQSLTNALGAIISSSRYHKVGQNLSFEHETMLWNFGVRGWNYHDTMLTEKVLHCGEWPFFAKDIWGLKDIVARYYRKALSKKEQTGFDLCTPLRQEQVVYAGLDIRLPIQIRELQLQYAAKDGLTRAIQIENDAIPAFCEMKVVGLPVNREEWVKIVESNEVLHRQHVATLDRFFIGLYGTKEAPVCDVSEGELYEAEMRWRREEDRELRRQFRTEYQEAYRTYKARFKDSDKWEGEAALNYGSDEEILIALRKMGHSVVATNEKALGKISTEPVVVALMNYRETKKALTTYGRAYLDAINPLTGRIHSTFQQLGAETGRTSSTRPNVQQLPSVNRKTVHARPGYVLITTDMSGAELRIMAELSGDPLWIEMFTNGWDVHSVLAEKTYGEAWLTAAESDCEYYQSKQKCRCKKHKEMRDAIKAINFGIAYGMSQYALAPRLGISVAKALQLLNDWKEINNVLAKWLKSTGESAKVSLSARTMSGFRRRFKKPLWDRAKVVAAERSLKDKGHEDIEARDISKVYSASWSAIEREGTNTPVQGSNAAIAKLAMGAGLDRNGQELMYHILHKYGAFLINFVHDEFVVECPEENADECKEAVKDCIRRAGAEFMNKVVMEAEANVSERWEK